MSSAVPTPANPPAVCPAVPCPPQMVCLEFACQCVTGTFLQDNECVPAQVFPGQLHLNDQTFQPQMSNRSSEEFKNKSAEIEHELFNVLDGTQGYVRSEVIQLMNGSIIALVNNIYRNSEIDGDTIQATITNSSNTFFSKTTYSVRDLCVQNPLPCEADTTSCNSTGGRATCSCLAAFIPSPYSSTSCKVCQSGTRADGSKCVPCPFGQAGFNCNDKSLLIVVIVSSILGACIIILVAGLVANSIRGKTSKNKSDVSSSPYATTATWPTSVGRLPRATTKWGKSSSTEMTEAHSVEGNHQSNGQSGSHSPNTHGLKSFSGNNTSRYSYLVKGHENPYYLAADV